MNTVDHGYTLYSFISLIHLVYTYIWSRFVALCRLPVGQKFQPSTLFLQRGQISTGPLSYDYLKEVQMVKISIAPAFTLSRKAKRS